MSKSNTILVNWLFVITILRFLDGLSMVSNNYDEESMIISVANALIYLSIDWTILMFLQVQIKWESFQGVLTNNSEISYDLIHVHLIIIIYMYKMYMYVYCKKFSAVTYLLASDMGCLLSLSNVFQLLLDWLVNGSEPNYSHPQFPPG